MTRTMADSERDLFEKLLIVASRSQRQILGGMRVLKTDVPESVNWLKSLKITGDPIEFAPNQKAACCNFNDNKYFVITGYNSDPIQNLPEFMCEQALNAGIFCAIAEDFNLQVFENASPAEIYNIVEASKLTDTNYDGVDYLVLAKFFPTIRIFEINSAAPPLDVFRALGIYLCRSHSYSLPFSDGTIESYEKIFLEGGEDIPIENIQMSLLSMHYKHAFLEIYRCLERKVPLLYADKLKEKLSHSCTPVEMVGHLESALGWYPNYSYGLEIVLGGMSPELAYRLKHLGTKYGLDSPKGNISKWLYKLRNANVHLSPNKSALMNLQDGDWNELVNILLLFLHQLDHIV